MKNQFNKSQYLWMVFAVMIAAIFLGQDVLAVIMLIILVAGISFSLGQYDKS